MIPFAAVLLAGGRSQRMGRDKALLTLPDGRRWWERQLGILQELSPVEVFVSGPPREGFPPGLPCLADERPGRGPLGGIAAALRHMTSPRLVVLAIDLPQMTSEFLQGLLVTLGDSTRGIVPRHTGADGFFEPLAAVYPAACRGLAEARLQGEDWSLQSFVRASGGSLQIRDILPGEKKLFANWNEPPHHVDAP